MKYILTILLAASLGYISYLRRELDNEKFISHLNYIYFVHAVEGRTKKELKLKECEESKELVELSEGHAWLQRDHTLAQSKKLTRRFKETTDILESVALCSYFKFQPSTCVGDLDINQFLIDNRKAKF